MQFIAENRVGGLRHRRGLWFGHKPGRHENREEPAAHVAIPLAIIALITVNPATEAAKSGYYQFMRRNSFRQKSPQGIQWTKKC
jgi:hypothetical protein